MSINIYNVITLTGNVTVQDTVDSSGNPVTLYGGSGVELFLGSGPARLSNGQINPNAVGILVTNASIGVVDYNGSYAVTAFGQASLLGIPDVTVSGSVLVRINKTGKAIDQTITLPGTNAPSITVNYANAESVFEFDAGYTESGTPATTAAAGLLTISAPTSSRCRARRSSR